ncbi:PREDICTED: 52 kDa repressor of the inhibitor of the protein kinase-like [Cyphomyrmex costatus]|uniref:52 kDa repressor of the inhibitor of the protein kinase-like n=1 Tax=Cyphomyrmex costatus TaxID=456900 RepID=UPI00085225E1|nr:PREDICTED: 52 kDa repressor of the inhibitor of the protein kinase-like [Cyphomyrmex costatus]
MNTKNVWCAVPECTKRFILKERYFFRFPKEREKWLQWVRACGRLDLEPKGPEYAYQNCRLCHLHFEEKWYKKNIMRARLHPDAVPTIFFGPSYKEENTMDMEIKEEVETNETIYMDGEPKSRFFIKTEQIWSKDGANKTQEKNSNMESVETRQKHVQKHIKIEVKAETNENIYIYKEPTNKTQEKNSNAESAKSLLITDNNVDAEIVKPSTSKDKKEDMKLSESSPKKNKLRLKIAKLKAQNKTLRETIRRLRLKKKKNIQAKKKKLMNKL